MLAAITWPILERIPIVGDFAISPHGIGVAAGFLLGGWLMTRRARRWGIGQPVEDISEAISTLLTWVAVGAIIGARLFYVLNHLSEFSDNPLSALALWRGGLTLLGGITGGVIAGIVVARRNGWHVGMLTDAAAAGLAAGIAVGRLGDLAIGDHIGAAAPNNPLAWRCSGNLWEASTNSFGWVVPQAYPTGGAPVQGCFDVPVIQTALFDSLAAAVTLLVILAVERRMRSRPVGVLTATFVAAYGTGRFTLDFFRGDVRYVGLTASQWTALVAATIAITWLLRRANRPGGPRHGPRDGTTEPSDETTEPSDETTEPSAGTSSQTKS